MTGRKPDDLDAFRGVFFGTIAAVVVWGSFYLAWDWAFGGSK